MNIGRPKRIIEIAPAELPLPDPSVPVFEPGTAPPEPTQEPTQEPTHAPSEPAEPPAAP